MYYKHYNINNIVTARHKTLALRGGTYQKIMYTWLSLGRCVPYQLAYKFSLPLSYFNCARFII